MMGVSREADPPTSNQASSAIAIHTGRIPRCRLEGSSSARQISRMIDARPTSVRPMTGTASRFNSHAVAENHDRAGIGSEATAANAGPVSHSLQNSPPWRAPGSNTVQPPMAKAVAARTSVDLKAVRRLNWLRSQMISARSRSHASNFQHNT